jgi:hypothetical protein
MENNFIEKLIDEQMSNPEFKKAWEEEKLQWDYNKNIADCLPCTAWQLMLAINKLTTGILWSQEGRPQKASNSEMRRWFDRKSVHINGKAANPNDEIQQLESFVLFPNSRSKITLW